eukprot:TRINITY_DN75872_c0_g1_i1.p1 TRINITY_DN75872_c0_g1~~TRINITY_DN75872_c0_g1_i1.p1  ORF type:complete len:302 (-),score=30.65 TRINITY_DN75872_c0_g1_i1:402-1307(-)
MPDECLETFGADDHESNAQNGSCSGQPDAQTISEMQRELVSLRREVRRLRKHLDERERNGFDGFDGFDRQRSVERSHNLEKGDEETLHNFWHRAGWLVALLMFQSTSSFILERFDPLLHQHPVVVYFLTMLVGAGGNAGGQSTVLVVRRLALEKMSEPKSTKTSAHIIVQQAGVGIQLAFLLSAVSLLRCWLFQVVGYEALAICMSIFCIVFTSSLLGSALPLILKRCGSDPAHAGAAIQVVMDITGVSLTCVMACLVLGVPMTNDPPTQKLPAIRLGLVNSSLASWGQHSLSAPGGVSLD